MFPLPLSRVSKRSSNIGVLLLLMQLCQTGFLKIPPVTLAVIFLNSAVYLGFIHPLLYKRYPEPVEVCVGIQQVWSLGEYWRLVEASFYHGDDLHLYFNMVSFLWKGISVECRLGSRRFLFLVIVLSVSVNIVMLYLNYLIAHFLSDETYMSRCAIGFSGVVFALKVVNNYMNPCATACFLGCFPVSGRFSFWFELVLIQLLVPNASLTGHLAGILLGLAFTKEPLKNLLFAEFLACCDTDVKCQNDPFTSFIQDCDSSDSDICENSDDDSCSQGDCSLYDNTNFFPLLRQGYNATTRSPAPPLQEDIPLQDDSSEFDRESTSHVLDFQATEETRQRRLEKLENLPKR